MKMTSRFFDLPVSGILAVIFSLAVLPMARAVNWDGGGSDDNWNAPENWVGDTLPGTTEQAVILGNTLGTAALLDNAQTVNDVVVGNSTSSGFLEITTGASLTTTATNENFGLVIGSGNGSGTVTMDGGTVNLSGGMRVSQDAGSTGTLVISGGSIAASQPIWIAKSGTGTVTQTNGSVATTNTGDSIRFGESSGALAEYYISGGSLSAARFLNLGRTDGGSTNLLSISGSGNVVVGASSEGGIRIRGNSTLEMDGSGADLGLNGHFQMQSGTFSALIDDAAIADPGSWNTISATDVQFDSGSLLNLGFSAGSTPADGTWRLLEWSRNVINGTAFLGLDPGVAPGWSFNLDTTNKFLDVTYTSVPEPTGTALLLFGAAGLFALRCRRR